MFNYTALALRQAGRQAGTTAWHGIQLAAQNGGKCPLHPALPAAGKPWQGSWAEPLALRSQTSKPCLLGQHLNCCAESHTSQNRIGPVWACPQPQGEASNALGLHDASERWARLDIKMPFPQECFQTATWQQPVEGEAAFLQSWDCQKKKIQSSTSTFIVRS